MHYNCHCVVLDSHFVKLIGRKADKRNKKNISIFLTKIVELMRFHGVYRFLSCINISFDYMVFEMVIVFYVRIDLN